MDSRPSADTRSGAAVAVAAVALTALGWWYATALQPLWWAAWLAPLPLLLASVRLRALPAALATWCAFALGGAGQWAYLHGALGLPLPVVLAAIVLPALAMVPAVLLFRGLARQGRPFAAAFALPAVATGLSWMVARASPHGTFGHLAYSQMDALPVVQLAAVGGLWMAGFLVWWSAAAVASALAARASRRARLRALAVAMLSIALALGFGAWRLQHDASGPTLRVALLAAGGPASGNADIDTPQGAALLQRYIATIDRLAAAQRIDLFVGPESPLLVHTRAVGALQAAADRHDARILIGAEDRSEPARARNAALVFEPGGAAPAAYFKRHLIPGLEARYTPGDARLLLAGTPPTAVAVCKDLDFTSTALDHARLGVALLLVPAWDFEVDAWLHARMAVMRGIEGGFAVARSARDGLLTLSDDRGRVLAETSAVGRDDVVSLVADLPLRASTTPYRRWGDAFGAGCLALALALAALAIGNRSGRRNADARHAPGVAGGSGREPQ